MVFAKVRFKARLWHLSGRLIICAMFFAPQILVPQLTTRGGTEDHKTSDALASLLKIEYLISDSPTPIQKSDQLRNDFARAGREFIDVSGKKCDSSTISEVLSGPLKNRESAWDKHSSCLPGDPGYFIAHNFDPLFEFDGEPALSVAAGPVQERHHLRAEIGEKQMDVEVVVLQRQDICSISEQSDQTNGFDAVSPSTILINASFREESVKRWRAAYKEMSNTDLPALKKSLFEKFKVGGSDPGPISDYLTDVVLKESGVAGVDSRWELDSERLAVGRLQVLKDEDFLYCLRISGVSNREKREVLTWYACMKALGDGGKSETPLSLICGMGSLHGGNSHTAGLLAGNCARMGLTSILRAILNKKDGNITPEEIETVFFDGGINDPSARKKLASVVRESMREVGLRLIPTMSADSPPDQKTRLLAVAEQSHRDYPGNGFIALATADLNFEFGRESRGQELCTALLKEPSDPEVAAGAARNLAVMDLRLGKYAEGIEMLNKSDKFSPDKPDTLFLLWHAQRLAKDYSAADATAARFKAVEPSGPRVQLMESEKSQ